MASLIKTKKHFGWAALLLAAVSVVLLYAAHVDGPKPKTEPNNIAGHQAAHRDYVGSSACIQCHSAQAEQWKTSDHFHAMAEASPESVLGNFDQYIFDYFGRKTLFHQKDGHYFVDTENQQGQTQTFEISHTLGHKPLQQYLVTFEDGRIQTLPFSWDTRNKEDGGQRWFHIYDEENITPDNPLFWTRPLQNWNHMCADCHSTNFAKQFSAEQNRFDSQWSELANGCESCHGPGSAHVQLMQENHPDQKADALINGLRSQQQQVDQCGVCHARRDRLQEVGSGQERMMHSWRPALLSPTLYFHDGQIRDEVFEIGSFMQSKMYAAGVTCTNCHEPHSGAVKIVGNGLCTQCHAATVYDQQAHHQHPENSTGAECVNCHMPERTYMVINPRRDHSFTIPEWTLSHEAGVPNACDRCHGKHMLSRKTNTALAESPHWGQMLWQLRNEHLAASEALHALINNRAVPSLVQATVLQEWPWLGGEQDVALIAEALRSPDALLRYGAVQSLSHVPSVQRHHLLLGVLTDESAAVRLAAAPLLVDADIQALAPKQQQALKKLFTEYRQWLLDNRDRPEALVNLAGFVLAQGDLLQAQRYFDEALLRDPTSLSAHLNYADYYRAIGNDVEAERLLHGALQIYPDSADVHFALGLLQVRQQHKAEALASLKQAVTLAPDNSHYVYVYGVGLVSEGQRDAGLNILRTAQQRFPANRAINQALQAYGVHP